MTNTLEEVLSTLQRVESTAQAILGKLQISGNQITVGSLDEISGALGLVKAGEFRSGMGEPGFGFTGIRMGAPGWLYSSKRYSIVGLKADVLQFGLSNEDGAVYAGAGAVVLDADGLSIRESGTSGDINRIKFYYDNTTSFVPIGAVYGDYSGSGDGATWLAAYRTADTPWTVPAVNIMALDTVASLDGRIILRPRTALLTVDADIDPPAQTGLTDTNDSHAFWVRDFSRTYVDGAYGFLEGSVFAQPTFIGGGATTIGTASTVTIQGAPILSGATATNNVGLLVGGGIRVASGNLDIASGNLSVSGTLSLPGTQGTWTVSAGGFSAAPTGMLGRYVLIGKMCTCFVRMPAAGTSNATTFTVNAPFTAATATNMVWYSTCVFTDNGTASVTPGQVNIGSAGTVFNLYKDFNATAWTASGDKRAQFSITYEIA